FLENLKLLKNKNLYDIKLLLQKIVESEQTDNDLLIQLINENITGYSYVLSTWDKEYYIDKLHSGKLNYKVLYELVCYITNWNFICEKCPSHEFVHIDLKSYY